MTLRDQLRHEGFTLALSSGFFGFFAHYGLSLALHEAGLKPARVTGSSAGAILAAAWSYGIPMHELRSVLSELKREKFWDPSLGFGLLKGERLEGLMREVFQGRRAALPFAISVFDIWKRKKEAFVEGDVPRLIRASCAVPLMFHPVKIRNRYYWDGGTLDKAAVASVAPDEKVLVHYLPSQGLHSVYEDRKALTRLRGRHLVLAPEDLPQVGPFRLDLGLTAIERAYENTVRFLSFGNQ